MNPFCMDCGWRLEPDPLHAWWKCRGCGKVVSDLMRAQAVDPVIHHGEPCQECDGTGLVERAFTEWHPYGDTTVPEELIEDVDCEACGGKGYFLDADSCVVCGCEVVDGILVQGWEVCEDCATDDVPTLEGFDS